MWSLTHADTFFFKESLPAVYTVFTAVYFLTTARRRPLKYPPKMGTLLVFGYDVTPVLFYAVADHSMSKDWIG